MKFTIKSSLTSSRLGVISDIARQPNFELETPHVFLYTKGGTIPHLSYHVLQKVSSEKFALHMPLSDMDVIQERMKSFKHSLADFIGMKEYITYMTYINPGEKRVSGFHHKNDIPISTKAGMRKFSASEYIKLVEDLQPDMFAVIADGDTDSKSSQKRMHKSFNKSVTLFEQCLDFFNKSETLQSCEMIGAVEGGYNLRLREESSKIVGDSSVFGAVIDGLHDCSEIVSEMTFKDIKPIVEASLKHIPDNKLRIIHGCWNPEVLLNLIEIGIDIFDSSYPYLICEQSGALVFPNNINSLEQIVQSGNNKLNSIRSKNGNYISPEVSYLDSKTPDEPVNKKIKLVSKSIYHSSMLDPCYVTDFSPILKDCSCYTCQKYTKAYIHHLLNVEEMLGSTLLMIHNLHHYLEFFSNIRNALKEGTFQEMKRLFQLWINKTDDISIS